MAKDVKDVTHTDKRKTTANLLRQQMNMVNYLID